MNVHNPVQPYDVDDPDHRPVHRRGGVLGPYEIRDGQGIFAGNDPRDDLAIGADLRVHGVLEGLLEAGRHLGQVEVHPGLTGLHVAASDERAVVAEDGAAEHVQARVGAHQAAAPVVVDRPAHLHADGWDGVARRRNQEEIVALAGVDDTSLHTLPQEYALIRWLSTAAREERRPVQDDPRLRIRRIGPDDCAVPLPDGGIHPIQPVRVPMMFLRHGWTIPA